MKRHIYYRLILMGLIIVIPLSGTEGSKPSAWQRFKNVFSSKDEQKDLNTLTETQKKSFLRALSDFRAVASKFITFSKEHVKMIEIKVKTLELVQERLTKISKGQSFLSKLFWKEKAPSPEIEQEKINLAAQLGRLRADLFITFVEIFQKLKPTLVSAKEIMQRGLFKNATVFDTMINSLSSLIVQGNNIGEKLLRASDAYGKKDSIDVINKEVELLINNYIQSAIKVMAQFQPVANAFKGVINIVRSISWVVNTVTFGSITTYILAFELVDKIVGAGKIAADLSKDIFVQVIEKNGIKSVKAKLVSTVKDVEKTTKKVEATDSGNEEDLLNLEDLKQR